jgi:molybdenum cofactor cytidylyltransferase
MVKRHGIRAEARVMPSVAAVILGAGLSTRMGSRNKLVVEVDGTPLIRRVAELSVSAHLEPVVVVVGPGARDVRRVLAGLPLSFAENPHPEAGIGGSLRVGLEALAEHAPNAGAVLVMLGDMPWVRPADVQALLAAFDPAGGGEICVPVHAGRRGNPVLWGERFFSEMKELRGDVGARPLMDRHADSVREVVVAGAGVTRDVDTLEDLGSLPSATDR